jgi:hypothetical protein
MATDHIPTANRVCSGDGCSCVVAENDAKVERDGQVYCSEECARGTGCDHPACRCGDRRLRQATPDGLGCSGAG